VVPTRATGTESRLPWLDQLATLPGQTTTELYANRPKREIVSLQHPDRDTPANWSPPRGAPAATE
jgi:hypothetical protein